MAYTDTWVNLENIAGATPANQIDDKFRARGLGIKERMNEIFVDWEADPVVLKDSVLGKVTGKTLVIPHTLFRERSSVGAFNATLDGSGMGAFGDTGVLQASIVLPPGTTLKLVEILINTIADSINWEVFSYTFGAALPTKTLIESATDPTAGVHFITTGVLSEVIDAQHTYHISVDSTSSSTPPKFVVYGARITYDTPSSQQTY